VKTPFSPEQPDRSTYEKAYAEHQQRAVAPLAQLFGQFADIQNRDDDSLFTA
jgi:hypothetical protein